MIIDLCCGIGRWQTGEEVIKIDIQRKVKPDIIADIRYLPLKPALKPRLKVKPDIIADIRYLPLKPALKPRLVHASPPCKYVSKARRWGVHNGGWNPKGIAESLRLIASCYDAFAYLEPENCTVEQPRGIEDILGHKVQFKYDKGKDKRNCTTNFYSNNLSLKRAVIPQNIRQSILEAISVEAKQTKQ